MSAGPYPELLVSRADTDPGPWEVRCGPLLRGEAWTDLSARTMRVPFGGGGHGRLVRAHELMHARVSPCGAGLEAPEEWSRTRAAECAEEYRVNALLRRVGFELRELKDGSERTTGRRLAESGERAELLYFAAAVAGTGAFGDLLRGVRPVDAGLADEARSLERELGRALRGVATIDLADTRLRGALPAGYAVHTRRLCELIIRAIAAPMGAPPAARPRRPAPTGAFASLVLDERVALERRIADCTGVRSVPAAHGRRVVRPARVVTDPARRCFAGRARRGGGVVVVDQSGSMALTDDELEGLLGAAPGAFVLGYSHAPGSVGVPNAWVLADRGRVASVRSGNVGNGVDGPALLYALGRRRPGEQVVWVGDGQVTDSSDHADLGLAAQCANLVLRRGILMVASVEEALWILRGGRPKTRRLLGRVGAVVTAGP